MFALIVERKVRQAWGQLRNRDTAPILAQLAPNFEHTFAGEHAMGGTRHTRRTQADWFARVFRLFPDIRFEVRDVFVKGYPWRTLAVAIVDVTLTDEPGYRNLVVQQLELRWGRITRIENLEDTQALARILQTRAATIPEALAPPIVD